MTNIEKTVYISREEKNGVTQQLLKELFDYKDGKFYRKISVNGATKIGELAGVIHKRIKRYQLGINSKLYLAARLVFLYHHGYLPEFVDYKDKNRYNDRIENLYESVRIKNNDDINDRQNKELKYLQQKENYVSREQKNGLTQDFLKEYFEYKDGNLFWIKKLNPHSIIGNKLGHIRKESENDKARYFIKIKEHIYALSRIIFLLHHGWLPPLIDHSDGDSLNNKIWNLREASPTQNSTNKKIHKNKKSKYKGVYPARGIIRTWVVTITTKDHVSKYIGRFKDEKEAALAYNREAVRYFGEFAFLNIIEP